MSAIMKIVGLADGSMFNHDLWLERYDTEARPERKESYTRVDGGVVVNGAYGGTIHLTPHRDDAMRFSSSAEAMLAWNTQSIGYPRRPDGRPNKPLTALTVEVQPDDFDPD